MEKMQKVDVPAMRGTKRARLSKRIKEIREKYATKFRKIPPMPGSRLGQHKTIKEPKEKLYGAIEVTEDGGKTFLIYKILKGWKYTYSPLDYNEKGELKKDAQPLSKDPQVEEIVEELK